MRQNEEIYPLYNGQYLVFRVAPFFKRSHFCFPTNTILRSEIKMRKFLKSSLSVICCIAILMSLFTALPLRSLAANPSQINLRIEGLTAEMYFGKVNFNTGESVYDIVKNFTKMQDLTLNTESSQYGMYITTIGNEIADSNHYWAFYINDTSSDKGVSSVFPHDGDSIVLANVDFSTNYPYITLSEKTPAPNDNITFHVSADVAQYGPSPDYTYLCIANNPIPSATVTFNDNPYTTDINGNVIIKMPSLEGTYNLSIQNSNSTYPTIIRTGLIPIKVTTTPESNCEFGIKDINRTVDFTVPGTAVTNLDILGGQAGIMSHSA
jgi:hypothetical protein